MTLREVTRAVIGLVENVSGCPVVASEDRSLTTLAASRIARGVNRIHTISFNPSAVREPDYLICYQCGFISLRVGQRRLQPEGGESAERSASAWADGLAVVRRGLTVQGLTCVSALGGRAHTQVRPSGPVRRKIKRREHEEGGKTVCSN
jgi:hypothetical protein